MRGVATSLLSGFVDFFAGVWCSRQIESSNTTESIPPLKAIAIRAELAIRLGGSTGKVSRADCVSPCLGLGLGIGFLELAITHQALMATLEQRILIHRLKYL